MFHQGNTPPLHAIHTILISVIVKHGLRKEHMMAVEGVEAIEAIEEQLGRVSPANAKGYYRDCGFIMD